MNPTESAARDVVQLPVGALEITGEDRVVPRGPDGSPAVAGDGVATALVARALVDGASEPGRAVDERALPVDMTNWNVVVDGRYLVKVPRLRGGCDRAARQLGRLAGTDVTPALLGVVEHGGAVLAMVTAYVPDSQDGWDWATNDVVAWVTGEAGPPTWPSRLGDLVGRMHRTLARGAHGAERGLEHRVEHAGRLLQEVVDGFPDVTVRERVRRREAALRGVVDRMPTRTSAPAFELHGDLHVGQVLRQRGADDDRYLVVDLDGDPQDPDGADLDGAVRDVAHLLVSLDLVAAVACRRLGRYNPRALAWSATAQDELLGAYRAVAGDLLDESLLPGLRAEQLLLELTYAWHHLPRWAYAPELALIARYPTDRPDPEEAPWTPPSSATT
jgi:maltokinase